MAGLSAALLLFFLLLLGFVEAKARRFLHRELFSAHATWYEA